VKIENLDAKQTSGTLQKPKAQPGKPWRLSHLCEAAFSTHQPISPFFQPALATNPA
jgi:hypothetical protein